MKFLIIGAGGTGGCIAVIWQNWGMDGHVYCAREAS